jgi:hypothetical protein
MAMALLSVVSLSIVAGVDNHPRVRYAFLCFGECARWWKGRMLTSYQVLPEYGRAAQ